MMLRCERIHRVAVKCEFLIAFEDQREINTVSEWLSILRGVDRDVKVRHTYTCTQTNAHTHPHTQ